MMAISSIRAINRKRAMKERKKMDSMFRQAISAGAQVEAGLKLAISTLPFFKRFKIAMQIIGRRWK